MRYRLLRPNEPVSRDLTIASHEIGAVLFYEPVLVLTIVAGNFVPWHAWPLVMGHMQIVVEVEQSHDWIALDYNHAAAGHIVSTVLRIGPHHGERIAPIGDA